MMQRRAITHHRRVHAMSPALQVSQSKMDQKVIPSIANPPPAHQTNCLHAASIIWSTTGSGARPTKTAIATKKTMTR